MITNNEIAEYIKDLIPFKANSIVGFYNQKGIYTIWSYQTPILEMKSDKTLIFFNNLYYSPTTSKTQNIICNMLNLPRKRGKKIYNENSLK